VAGLTSAGKCRYSRRYLAGRNKEERKEKKKEGRKKNKQTRKKKENEKNWKQEKEEKGAKGHEEDVKEEKRGRCERGKKDKDRGSQSINFFISRRFSFSLAHSMPSSVSAQ
jgi:hypothetical protein